MGQTQTFPKGCPGQGEKIMRFAKECGFHKLGLAFCDTLDEQGRQIDAILRRNGFQVESVRCKVGHIDSCTIGVPSAQKAMCNPIAQAELLNEAGAELNIIVGLCVGHDALFIRHSKAPVTVLAAKDHVYDNAPLECLKDMQPCLPGFLTLTELKSHRRGFPLRCDCVMMVRPENPARPLLPARW